MASEPGRHSSEYLGTAIYPTYQGEKYQVAINFKNIHLALEQWPEVMRKGQRTETQSLRKIQGLGN